ncbi:hypothetical protein [Actinophytocola sp.]|uniref:hypothetical protein n=1 Tax=Actinophytocola sp. TaxID=1872138 RepID=UPI002D7EB073|nr:hypothetical protein [Actinophytocola sp.]HET9138447.1 hypothetical protein [Actinophytocola sp.]
MGQRRAGCLVLGLILLLTSACAGNAVAGAPVPIENPVSAPAKVSRPRPPITVSTTAPPQTARPSADVLSGLVGVWEGEYTCTQGLTGMKVTLGAPSAGIMPVTVEFFPLPSNPSVPKGSYTMAASLGSGGQLMFKQQQWINQPPGYTMIDMVVTSPVRADVKQLSGDILKQSCKGFSLRRP